VILRVSGIDPEDGILDFDALGRLQVRMHFSKAIDLWPDNLGRFRMLGAGGSELPIDVSIANNDALLTLQASQGLGVGSALTAVALHGVQSVKPISATQHIVLYTLAQDQRFPFEFRGSRPELVDVDAVVPRRVLLGRPDGITISGRGIPVDPQRVRVFVGTTELIIRAIQSSDDAEAAAIIMAETPAFAIPGQYDVTIHVEKDGIWQSASLAGGLMVDAPIRFDSVTPSWGPVEGGTTVTVLGRGFEPGTTVSEGTRARVGDVPVRSLRVLTTQRLEFVTPGGRVGRNGVYGQDRYGNSTSLTGDAGFGYGLRKIGQAGVTFHPSDVFVDRETGIAVTNSGYMFEQEVADMLREVKPGVFLPEILTAATFDVQSRAQPVLVGGAPSLPSAEKIKRYLADEAYREGEDSIRLLPVVELEQGVQRKRLYVTTGPTGVTRLNLDEQNGLQFIGETLANNGDHTGAVAKSGHMLFAAQGQVGACPPGADPPICGICNGMPGEKANVRAANYVVGSDPVLAGDIQDEAGSPIAGGNAVVIEDDWLFAGGFRSSVDWNPQEQCALFRGTTASPPFGFGDGTIRAINLYDPALSEVFAFGNGMDNVADLTVYGDYVIAAASTGLVIINRQRPELIATFKLSPSLQTNAGGFARLRRAGNLLFASAADGGVIVLDIRNPLAPRVVSAGNVERFDATDFYKDRMLSADSGGKLAVFDLPGSFVAATSVNERGYIAEDESYRLTFNEHVTVASLTAPGAVTVTSVDSAQAVAATVQAVAAQGGASDRFDVAFARQPGSEYEVRVNSARNLRAGELWTTFQGRLRAASAGARRPRIDAVDGGVSHRGDQSAVTIRGAGFRSDPSVQVLVGKQRVAHTFVDAATLRLAPSAIDSLPFDPGHYPIRVVDGELTGGMPGAIVLGVAPVNATFELDPQSGSSRGGELVKIEASAATILPGSTVFMRGRSTNTLLRTEPNGRDLEDDVQTLQTFEFRLPGLLENQVADIYDVHLVTGGKEVLVGSFSYELEEGRDIDLPNYPPMIVGAAQIAGDLLYVGVRGLLYTPRDNRFVLPRGLEIYDINIWDRPIRLSQTPTSQPVTGLAVQDQVVYLAAGSDGLVIVSVLDPSKPHVVGNIGVPGSSATDVAIDAHTGVLAMSVSDGAGGGFVRFFDTGHPELAPPAGYATISFSGTEPHGEPADVDWLDGKLYVLTKQGDAAVLYEFSSFGANPTVKRYPVPRVGGQDIRKLSLVVRFGQIAVAGEDSYVVLEPNAQNGLQLTYWQDEDSTHTIGELAGDSGTLFMADGPGLIDTPVPKLALVSVNPPFGASLTAGEHVRLQFSELINTAPDKLAQSVRVLDGSGAPLSPLAYTLTGINTVAGGYIDLALSDALLYVGPLRIEVTTAMTDLDGRHLGTPVSGSFQIVPGIRPQVKSVARAAGTSTSAPYFHADGSEQALIRGERFGSDPQALTVLVGDQPLPPSAILAVQSTEIRIRVPALNLTLASAALPVTVVRNGVSDTLHGALVVQPRLALQALDPAAGPPEGGNTVSLFGVGFNQSLIVKFDGARAGDLRLRSSSQLDVRAPSGSFGPADVSVSSSLFPDEESVLSGRYFYTNKETGSVKLADSGQPASPVVGLAIKDQILYSITGGGFQEYDRDGRLVQSYGAAGAQLALADVSDPVHPQLISKKVGEIEQPYHVNIQLQPDGFRGIAVDGDSLFVVGGNRLLHFDITLPADPLLLNDLSLLGAGGASDLVNDVSARDGLVYVSCQTGVRIYQSLPDGTLQPIDTLAVADLGGVPNKLAIDDDTLWVSLANAPIVRGVDLMRGYYEPLRTVHSVDLNGRPAIAAALLVRDGVMLIATGSQASVVVHQLRLGADSPALAQLPLAHLTDSVPLFAGALALQGQTLYVAGGNGDVQLFDVGPWLDLSFSATIELANYYSVFGSTGFSNV
jgi:large repetitive protein